ncbi:MAG: hypothetical protein ACYTGR_19850, partial [Planctomycetota bacterium]
DAGGITRPSSSERRPIHESMLADFGAQVSRWQIGSLGGDPHHLGETFAEAATGLRTTLATLAPAADLIAPWPAEQPLEPAAAIVPHGYTISVPYETPPESLLEFSDVWRESPTDVSVRFVLPGESLYGPHACVIDLALRALHGWRAGLPRMMIDAPWRTATSTGGLMPTPAFGVWRTMADQLGNRRFIQELDLAGGSVAWLLEGASNDDAAIVAWLDRPSSPQDAVLRMFLGDGPISTVDIFGNRTPVPLADGVHTVHLGEEPTFIEGIDLRLAQFRAAFRMVPDVVPTSNQRHEHRFVLENPWDVAMTGSMRVTGDDRWAIKPRQYEFNVSPGETADLPVAIIPERNIVAGEKILNAHFDFNASGRFSFDAKIPVDVTMKDIELRHRWSLVDDQVTGRKNIVVQLTIINHRDTAIDIDAFAYAAIDEIGIRRTTVGMLEPDTSTVQIFTMPDGAELLSGKTIYVGISERNRSSRLTEVMHLPNLRPVTEAHAIPMRDR